MMEGNDGKTWSTTGQTETTAQDPATGRFGLGVMVSFTTNKGINATVFIPDAKYNVANVRAAILAKIEHLHAVADLEG